MENLNYYGGDFMEILQPPLQDRDLLQMEPQTLPFYLYGSSSGRHNSTVAAFGLQTWETTNHQSQMESLDQQGFMQGSFTGIHQPVVAASSLQTWKATHYKGQMESLDQQGFRQGSFTGHQPVVAASSTPDLQTVLSQPSSSVPSNQVQSLPPYSTYLMSPRHHPLHPVASSGEVSGVSFTAENVEFLRSLSGAQQTQPDHQAALQNASDYTVITHSYPAASGTPDLQTVLSQPSSSGPSNQVQSLPPYSTHLMSPFHHPLHPVASFSGEVSGVSFTAENVEFLRSLFGAQPDNQAALQKASDYTVITHSYPAASGVPDFQTVLSQPSSYGPSNQVQSPPPYSTHLISSCQHPLHPVAFSRDVSGASFTAENVEFLRSLSGAQRTQPDHQATLPNASDYTVITHSYPENTVVNQTLPYSSQLPITPKDNQLSQSNTFINQTSCFASSLSFPPPPPPPPHRDFRSLLDKIIDCATMAAFFPAYIAATKEILSEIERSVSPIGHPIQRVAYYFYKALFSRISKTNYPFTVCSLKDHVVATEDFISVSPLLRVGHFVANQAILKTIESASEIHIIDMGMSRWNQWESVLAALASRLPSKPTKVRISGVAPSDLEFGNLITSGHSLYDLARKLDLNFEFQPIRPPISSLNRSSLGVKPNEVLVVNFMFRLHLSGPAKGILHLVKSLNPKIVTVAEYELSMNQCLFSDRIKNALPYYIAIFESLEQDLEHWAKKHRVAHSLGPHIAPHRARVEMSLFARQIGSIVAMDEGRVTGMRFDDKKQWKALMDECGFISIPHGNYTLDWAKNILSQYSSNYSLTKLLPQFLSLAWKDVELVNFSLWC